MEKSVILCYIAWSWFFAASNVTDIISSGNCLLAVETKWWIKNNYFGRAALPTWAIMFWIHTTKKNNKIISLSVTDKTRKTLLHICRYLNQPHNQWSRRNWSSRTMQKLKDDKTTPTVLISDNYHMKLSLLTWSRMEGKGILVRQWVEANQLIHLMLHHTQV